ncbi:acetyl-CoA acetyltransferase [Novosphingobium sp. B1]|uniref:acetyl-CoA acetyltransferase n=1 Tax=Novosphingobium sp. B1 TaxID=1938756 RepID=UPI00111C35FE|nr:acetyl-CoA acetyltransferase [Novosphingobium sp. B1]
MTLPETTPVIVGVGQFVERIDSAGYRGLGFADLAAHAVRAALSDAGSAGDITPLIKAVGSIRTFEESGAMQVPFGRADHLALAVCRRLNIKPAVAILEKGGGQSPLALLSDLGSRIAAGDVPAALMFGSEAISTVRHLQHKGETRDWSEHDDPAADGIEWIDKGLGFEGTLSATSIAHGIRAPVTAYALCENARRARLGLSRQDYAARMGELFAPFTEVAAGNPYSAAAVQPMSPKEIVEVSSRNRLIAAPYPLKLVSRDQVNQAAAVLVMSAKAAREAGIPEDRWVYLHGAALTSEREILERPDIGAYPAANAAIAWALDTAEATPDGIDFFDFYSCFPAPVFNAAIDGLGLSSDDPRKLTLTGGLPYFGGAGNNYSTHALATMVERLRGKPGSKGLVGMNGGFQSKYGACVLSTGPRAWPGCETRSVQQMLDAAPRATLAPVMQGRGHIETYTVVCGKTGPEQAIVIGAMATGDRFIAQSRSPEVLAAMLANDPLGHAVTFTAGTKNSEFALS